MVWFPELFNRYEEFESVYPGEKASVCDVSSIVLPNSTYSRMEGDPFCGEPIGESVFLHTLIIGLACIPTSFWLPLCVHRLGAKFFLGKRVIIISVILEMTIHNIELNPLRCLQFNTASFSRQRFTNLLFFQFPASWLPGVSRTVSTSSIPQSLTWCSLVFLKLSLV